MGISREYIREISPLCEETNIDLYNIYNSTEVFITATPFCMLPVVSVNGVSIGDGKPGQDYQQVLKIWSDNVGIDIKGQIQKWNAEESDSKQGTSTYSFKDNGK